MAVLIIFPVIFRITGKIIIIIHYYSSATVMNRVESVLYPAYTPESCFK